MCECEQACTCLQEVVGRDLLRGQATGLLWRSGERLQAMSRTMSCEHNQLSNQRHEAQEAQRRKHTLFPQYWWQQDSSDMAASLTYLERGLHVLIQLHHRSDVATPARMDHNSTVSSSNQVDAVVQDTPVAIVGRRPHSDKCLVEHPLVAFHDQLVRTRDGRQTVHSVELQGHSRATTTTVSCGR